MEGKTAKFALLMIGKTEFLTFKSKKAAQNLFFQSKKCIFAVEIKLIHCCMDRLFSTLSSQTGVAHQLSMPTQGDLVVDGKWLFEVGGKNKGFSQIKNVENSFVVSDKIDIGHGDKIPLWLFGLLY